MKRNLILSACLLGLSLTASAQFKIHSNGNMSFKRSASSAPVSPISLKGNVSDSTYFVTYSGNKNGMFIHVNGNAETNGTGISHGGYFKSSATDAETLVGLRGYGNFSLVENSSNPGSVGVWGSCFNFGANRYGYGVFGRASGDYYSAGVCGLSAAVSPSSTNLIPDGYYAGLFVGNTKVVGTITSSSSVQGTSLICSPSLSGETALVRSIEGEGVTGKLLGLTTLSYQHQQQADDSRPRPTFLENDPVTTEEMKKLGVDASKLNAAEEDVLEAQIQKNHHYALSADELEDIFPNLVYTDKNGGKAINYVEMVPLLVQCINELNARLSALDGNVGAGVGGDLQSLLPARSQTTAIDGTPSKTKAVLYPNPFTAQTEIRFSLPDDAPQAYIYIFDMTGKMQKQIPVNPDQQSVTINGYELQAGIYLYSLVVGGQGVDTKRMIITK